MKHAICLLILGLQTVALAYVGWMSWDAVHWQGAENYAGFGSAMIGLPTALVSVLAGFAVVGLRREVPSRFRAVYVIATLIMPVLTGIFAAIGAQG